MSRPLLLAVVVAAALALGASRGEASCVATLTWQDNVYVGHAKPVESGAALPEKATLPACNDVVINGEPVKQERDTKVAVRQVRDVDPAIAITRGDSVYVNRSTFPNLRSHPLHELLGSDSVPRRTGASCRISGRARTDFSGISIKRGHGVARVTIARDTDVELERHGTGYVSTGAMITVAGRPCKRSGGVLWISAQRISRAP